MQRLNPERLRSLFPNFVAIGIDVLEPGGALRILWVEGTAQTYHVLNHIDFSWAFRGAVNAKTTDRLYLRTKNGEEFFLELYEITRGMFGYALGSNSFWRSDREFATAIGEAFGNKAYTSTERYHELAQAVFESGRERALSPADDEPPFFEGRGPARVVFYAADHNAAFARALLNQDPDHVVIVPLGFHRTPAAIAQELNLLGSTRTISQVIFACLGAEAMFDAGPMSPPVDSPTGVGLYPRNTPPDLFGAIVNGLITFSGTITLLSCNTAGSTVFQGQSLDGKNTLRRLAAASNAWVVASDKAVIIDGTHGIATTDGTIYACSPEGPVQVFMRPSLQKEFPLDAMPTIKDAP